MMMMMIKMTTMRIIMKVFLNRSLQATAQCAPIDLAKVDKEASNGVIHVLNSVMIPPEGNIVKALSGRDNFKQLVKAVTDAKLVDTLNGDGPFTVFAPTDEAFAKIEKKKLEELLKDTDKLTSE